MAIVATAYTPTAASSPGTPTPPDITTGLVNDWRFDDLGLAAAAPVTEVTAVAGSLQSTLNNKGTSPSNNWPTIQLDAQGGHDALAFASVSRQCLRSDEYPSGSRTPLPATKAVLFKRASSASQILWTGATDSADSTSRGQQVSLPSTGLFSAAEIGVAGALMHSDSYDTDWHVGIVVFDGATSKVIVDGVVVSGALSGSATAVDPRDTFGSNVANSANFFDGLLLRAMKFDRVLPPADLTALDTSLRSWAGLA